MSLARWTTSTHMRMRMTVRRTDSNGDGKHVSVSKVMRKMDIGGEKGEEKTGEKNSCMKTEEGKDEKGGGGRMNGRINWKKGR
jgi:hypothetical protein